MPQADVCLDRVTKRFAQVIAVNDLSLEIERGEFFSLLGPSGCGKTTTLRMIAGFEEVTAGTIYLGDADVTNRPPYKRDVNTVFQNYALFPHLNVFENVAFGLRRRKTADSEIKRRVGEMLELVELPGYERRRTNQLSGGQQQRVALARALINHPQVLLLDEPLGALDLKLRKQMQLELKRIQTEVGITFVYVTHDQEEAMTMSDRIAVMRAGTHRTAGRGRRSCTSSRRPSSWPASWACRTCWRRASSRAWWRGVAECELNSGGTVHAPGNGLAAGTAVRVGVRPEKLRMAAAAGALDDASIGPAQQLEATRQRCQYVGVSTQYVVRLDDGTGADRLRPEHRHQWRRRAVLAGRANAPDVEAAAHIHRDRGTAGRRAARCLTGTAAHTGGRRWRSPH